MLKSLDIHMKLNSDEFMLEFVLRKGLILGPKQTCFGLRTWAQLENGLRLATLQQTLLNLLRVMN